MKNIITEIREWITIKNSEATILSDEYCRAKNEGYGRIVMQQIDVAYTEVITQRNKLRKALANLL